MSHDVALQAVVTFGILFPTIPMISFPFKREQFQLLKSEYTEIQMIYRTY